MKKYENILLLMDMDGTLLDNDRRLSDDKLETLKYFTENGGMFSVATGRMESTTKNNFKNLPINAPGIFHNGALVYDIVNDEKLWSCPLPEKTINIVNRLFIETNCGLEILSEGTINVLRKNVYTERQKEREGFVPNYTTIDRVSFPWYKILIADEKENLDKVLDRIISEYSFIDTVFSENHLLDILAPQVSKGNALKVLLQILSDKRRIESHGFFRDQLSGNKELITIACGDNVNDIDMIKQANIGIAVSNAKDEVKNEASHIVCSNEENVVEDIIKIIDSKL